MKTPPRSVLVIVARRLGDVLLATPLIRSVKRAWPDAAVDVLVFEGTQGVLANNPDVRRVLAVSERMKVRVEGRSYEDEVAKKTAELPFGLERRPGEAGGRT